MAKRNAEPAFPYEPGYPPTWRGKFARMVPHERALLLWWLDNSPRPPDALWYDVGMDGIPDDQPTPTAAEFTSDPAMARMWWHQTAKRADAIARAGSLYRIVELRASANAQTLGELLTYDALSRAEWPSLDWAPTLLVTHQVDLMHAMSITRAGHEIIVAPLIDPVTGRPFPLMDLQTPR